MALKMPTARIAVTVKPSALISMEALAKLLKLAQVVLRLRV